MLNTRCRWGMVLLVAILLTEDISAATREVRGLKVYPEAVALRGADTGVQLIVTAETPEGKSIDVTADAVYDHAEAIVRVNTGGRVQPLADGNGRVVVRYANQSATVPVKVTEFTENLPINFATQVVPVFTKLGCNGGGCHGKQSGQNGFKLSLLGFEPELDYNALVKEGRGRRLLPTLPDASLFMLKGAGLVAHGGGKKMDKDSDEYRLVRRWIASGMPYGQPTDPVVTRISTFPAHRILSRQSKQQFAVYAHYTDGSVEDITRRALYESNDTEVAIVDGGAMVRTLDHSGEAAIMARYQGHVGTFRATVPLETVPPPWTFPKQTFIDDHTSRKWRELGLAPSELTSDTAFLRRVMLDLTGTLPTPKEVNAFTADPDVAKRDKLVDRLTESKEYAYHFAGKWADILRVKRGEDRSPMRMQGTFAFHNWIREAMAEDKPYDRFAREILVASGEEVRNPAITWYKEMSAPEQFNDDTAQVFLGLRITCAQCHHHPYEKWSQDDYWNMAAHFGQMKRKFYAPPGGDKQTTVMTLYNRSENSVMNKRTGQPAIVKPLDAPPMEPTDDDPRSRLADWVTDAKNPYFAKAVANRYWAHFFGRGIVDPLDDMRITNPPSNPELLDTLAQSLIESRYSLRTLTRVICKSRTYQLSSSPNEFNRHDKQTYARYYPKRLPAEVLLDAVNQLTGAPAEFGGIPRDRFSPNRAIMLPDEGFNSYFMDVFGRPTRTSACSCERITEANLAQSLHLLNSDDLQNRITRDASRAQKMLNDRRSDAEKVEELFLWAFGRKPTANDRDLALAHLEKHSANKKVGYENIIWALINTKEFVFNQ